MLNEVKPALQLSLFFSGTRDVLTDPLLVDFAAGYLFGMGRSDKDVVNYFRERTFAESETFLESVLANGRDIGRFSFEGDPLPIARSLWALMEGCILQMRRQPADEIEETMFALWDVFAKGIGLKLKK